MIQDRVQQQLHRQTSGESMVVITDYDRTVISEADASGIALVSTLMHERFVGSLNGVGTANNVQVLHPDGNDTFNGVGRFTGTLEGRVGSCAFTNKGYTTAGAVHGQWEVVLGSCTGDLIGLRGYGVFSAKAPHSGDDNYGTITDRFTYWFEDN